MSVKCFEELGGGEEGICQASPKPPRWRTRGLVRALCSGPATGALCFLSHLSQGPPRRAKPCRFTTLVLNTQTEPRLYAWSHEEAQ